MEFTELDNSPNALREFLKREGLAPQKRWGQNFMVSPGARAQIIGTLSPGPKDTVWEIGPGIGAITSSLVATARHTVVFEIDHGLIRVLRKRFGKGIEIVEGDAVKTVPHRHSEHGAEPPDLIVGNLPYRAAAAIVAAILETPVSTKPMRRMVYTVQREMARRMVAQPGSKEYSALSVLCQISGDVRIVGDMAAGSFYPVPGVVSSLVSLDPRDADRGLVAAAGVCSRALFGSRRKTVRNNLPRLATAVDLTVAELLLGLDECGIDPRARAETIEPGTFLNLARWIRTNR